MVSFITATMQSRPRTARTVSIARRQSCFSWRSRAAEQSLAGKAKAAYQDFLTLWKDADPDITILKQAKAGHGFLLVLFVLNNFRRCHSSTFGDFRAWQSPSVQLNVQPV